MKPTFFLSAAIFAGMLLTPWSAVCGAAPVSVPQAKSGKTLKLQLPPTIYAVPGVETNVYFDNVVLTPNAANYIFNVDCAKGRNDAARWRFTPKSSDVGVHDWKLEIFDADGLVAEGKTRLVVSPADAGKGRKIAILIVGDSLTAATFYPARILKLFRGPGNPETVLLGTSGRGGKPGADGVAHEGYGGWTWHSFLTKAKPSKVAPGKPVYSRHRASPFLVAGDGKFDFAAYLKKNCGGKIPDFITIQLGVNDIFGANDDNVAERTAKILKRADQLIAEFRKAAPDAIIGVGLVTPPAATQDAFGSNYRCGQTRWQYRKNQHYLNAEMLKKFSAYPDKKVRLVPSNVNLDCRHNFPARTETINQDNPEKIVRQSNGVHPAAAGYHQMGDTFYCWMKSVLNSMR